VVDPPTRWQTGPQVALQLGKIEHVRGGKDQRHIRPDNRDLSLDAAIEIGEHVGPPRQPRSAAGPGHESRPFGESLTAAAWHRSASFLLESCDRAVVEPPGLAGKLRIAVGR